MCATCGCDEDTQVKIMAPGQSYEEDHLHVHDHHHDHSHHHHPTPEGKTITLEEDVLSKNNLLAERNRGYFEAKNMLAINLVSSPGSGKTTLLEKSIKVIAKVPVYVIEGDQQTMNDADRIAATGAPVIQVNTGNGCHLDADMIHKALHKLNPGNEGGVLFIENVGNLVCPSLFDLGEKTRVVIMSVTEGDDKPLKYPNMFATSQLCVINKIDLLPYVDFDVEKAKSYALQINPNLEFIELSATKEENIEDWVHWLKLQYSVHSPVKH